MQGRTFIPEQNPVHVHVVEVDLAMDVRARVQSLAQARDSQLWAIVQAETLGSPERVPAVAIHLAPLAGSEPLLVLPQVGRGQGEPLELPLRQKAHALFMPPVGKEQQVAEREESVSIHLTAAGEGMEKVRLELDLASRRA